MQENLLAVIRFDCDNGTAANAAVFAAKLLSFFQYRAARPAAPVEDKTKSAARVSAHRVSGCDHFTLAAFSPDYARSASIRT
jgi:hypothetical protein